MPHSDRFEALLRKAMHDAPLPPVPDSLLRQWQPRPARAGQIWIWLMPLAVFALGLLLGTALAPTSLGGAVVTFKAALAGVWATGIGEASGWALALLLAAAAVLGDNLRVVWRRWR